MELTTLGLKKPTQNEFYDINVHNENMDLLDSLVKNLSNENLLVNGDFRVNQRGQTIYSDDVSVNTNCFDCWKVQQATITQLVKGVNFKTSYNLGKLNSYIEDYEYFKGKTVTLSCKVNNASNNLLLQINDGIGGASQPVENGLVTVTATISENATKLQCVFYNNNESGVEVSADIEYMKLEFGSVATPYYPKPYGEELLKCQRYHIRYIIVGRMFECGTYNAKIVLDLPVTMAKVPDVEYFDSTMTFIKMGDENSTTVAVTNVGILNVSNNTITLSIEADYNYTTWTACCCENLGIALSAELE